VKNEKKETMMSLLIDSRIKEYDLLTIQKSWRNACVSTFYNTFNIDFHLLYENTRNVKNLLLCQHSIARRSLIDELRLERRMHDSYQNDE
jgi:hypothetical protein